MTPPPPPHTHTLLSSFPCLTFTVSNSFIEFYHNTFKRKEGNVLFNDALKTCYLRLYGVGHIIIIIIKVIIIIIMLMMIIILIIGYIYVFSPNEPF